jgi:ribosomal silencing factor RsfS
VTLPPNSKKLPADGWAMVDAGNFAVHVISRSARDRFFENRDLW